MIIYSKKIIQYITDVKRLIKAILSKEIGVKVAGDRFYNPQHTASYPIKIVIYNNKSMLGYFDSSFYELGIHECLMHSSHTQLQDILRHELAHYLTFIVHGAAIQPHGAEFKAFCEKMGWGEEVFRASTCLEDNEKVISTEESAIFRKIQKLMALATSSNENEAEQAIIKSQQLLLKHHIESKYLGNEEEEKIFLKRIMKQKKDNAKMRAIANILETFFVNIVYNRADGFVYLEVLGSLTNIEIAEYVAGYLHHEMDKLWNLAKFSNDLKGKVAKNSFFLGLAKGYCNKIEALKREYNNDTTNALILIEKKLSDAKMMVYPRLSMIKSRRNYCPESSALGEQAGKKLNIHPAIHKSSNSSPFMLALF